MNHEIGQRQQWINVAHTETKSPVLDSKNVCDFFSLSFLLPALPVGIVVFQMFCVYYIKKLMNFRSEILTDICIKIVLKKPICKETSCCCSHEILDPIPIWIVILPFIFCHFFSCLSHFVLMFSPYHLLDSSQFKQFHCFYFLQENIRLSVFWNLETEKPDGYLSRESSWWLPAYLLAVDSDSSVLYWILSGAEARTGHWDKNEVPDEKLTKPTMTGTYTICPISSSENKNSEKVDRFWDPQPVWILLLSYY